MKRWILMLLIFASPLTAFCENRGSAVIEPLLPLSLRSAISPAPVGVGFFSTIQGPLPLSEEGRRLVDKAVFWNWMSIGGFGASTLSLIITHFVDRAVGGILSLISVGFGSASNLAAAFAHRNISNEIAITSPDVPRPLAAGVASLVGGLLGVGTLAAISLSFGDVTGAAEIAAYIGFGLSTLAGGYGLFKSFEYASAAGADLSFF